MPTIDELTDQEFLELLDDYFAEPQKRYKMTEEEIRDLANRLNRKINVPIINETGELKILIKIVMKVDTFLYDHLPNEFYELVRSLDRGIDDDEAKRLIKRLATLANDKIDIPYLPEAMEYIAIRFILAIIINAARKQFDLLQAIPKVEALDISDKEKASNAEMEALIVSD